MEKGDEEKGELWDSKPFPQLKNKLDGEEDIRGDHKRRKCSNEGIFLEDSKMDDTQSADLIQLQEQVQTKNLTIQTLQYEIQRLKQNVTSPQGASVAADSDAVEKYKKKIQEFQAALSERDNVIDMLQGRVVESDVIIEKERKEKEKELEKYKEEIDTLKVHLSDAIDCLSSKKWMTGVEPREHLELKNKVIKYEQDIQHLMMQLTDWSNLSVDQKVKVNQLTDEITKIKSEKSEELRGVRMEVDQSKNIIDELRKQIKELKEQQQEREIAYRNLDLQYQQLQTEKQHWDCKSNKLKDFDKLKIEVDKLLEERKDFEKLSIEVVRMEEEIVKKVKLEAELMKLCTHLDQYKEQNHKLQMDIDNERKENKELRNKYVVICAQHEEVVQAKQKLNSEWESHCKELGEKLQSLDKKLADAQRNKELEEKSLQNKIRDLVCKLKEAEDNISRGEVKVRDSNSEKEAIARELELMKKKCDTLEDSNSEKEAIARELEQIRKKCDTLENEKRERLLIKEQESPVDKKDEGWVNMEGLLLELLQHWDAKAAADPVLAHFVERESCKIQTIMQDYGRRRLDSTDGPYYIESALHYLRNAITKCVGEKYQHIAEKMLNKLDGHIKASLASYSSSDVEDMVKYEVHWDERSFGAFGMNVPEDVARSIEDLTKAKTSLVNSAKEFTKELKESINAELSSLRTELKKINDTARNETLSHELQATVQQVSREYREGILERRERLPKETLEKAGHEFMEMAKRQYEDTQAEKLQILESQTKMVFKILEDNKAKVHTMCCEYINKVQDATTPTDAASLIHALTSSLEEMLQQEMELVDEGYREMLQQYTDEQNVLNQSHKIILQEQETRLWNLLLCDNGQNVDAATGFTQGGENEAAAMTNLHQLEIWDTDVMRNLQSFYTDRDWYKKTVGLLSHVTLQLIHYYSVAETYINQCKNVPHQEPSGNQDLTSGKVLDLSFLSEGGLVDDHDTSQHTIIPEDSAISTGANSAISTGAISAISAGRFINTLDEEIDVKSALDSTVMSEGMLDDMDKDEQVRELLTKSYPQLMAILKGRWNRVNIDILEKEIQELTISIQAAAGMLKIFSHSVSLKQDQFSGSGGDHLQSSSLKETSLELSQYQLEDIDQPYDQIFLNLSKHESLPHQDTDRTDANLDSLLTAQSSLNCQEDLAVSLSHYLSHSESFLNLTKLQPQDISDEKKLGGAIMQLCQAMEENKTLQLKLHHLQGLLKGSDEEKKVMGDDIEQLSQCNKDLVVELQTLKGQLMELDLRQQDKEGSSCSSQHTARMESSKDMKERVRALLSAKNKSMWSHQELVTRVSELEAMLADMVKETSAEQEKLKLQVVDRSQQLEVADRQLRTLRQFVAEHASERDHEVEELVQAKEKLVCQLREKEAVINQRTNMGKEVEDLEQELREKSKELQDVLDGKEELLTEKKAAADKIRDLREIIQTLETQIDSKEQEAATQIESLKSALSQAQQQQQDAEQQLEEHKCKGKDNSGHQEAPSWPMNSGKTEEDIVAGSESLYQDLGEENVTYYNTNRKLVQALVNQLDRTTRGLEAVQASSISATHSEEDLSDKDHLEVPFQDELGSSRAPSPSTLDQQLEEKFFSLERTTEAVVKRIRDLEMTMKTQRFDLDEAVGERDALQERSSAQLVQISSLEARLDELRCSDHPMAGELRQRLTSVQDELEKKRNELAVRGREVEGLKHNLRTTRDTLVSREEQLDRLHQSHSLPHSAMELAATKYKQLEEENKTKDEIIDKLKNDLAVAEGNAVPSTLNYQLMEEKDSEIESLRLQIKSLLIRVNQVLIMIKQEDITGSIRMLESIAKGSNFHDSLDSLSLLHQPEILRKETAQQSPILSPSIVRDSKGEASSQLLSHRDQTTTSQDYHDLSLMPMTDGDQVVLETTPLSTPSMNTKRSESEEGYTDNTTENEEVSLTPEDNESQCAAFDEVHVHRAQIEILQKEISSLNDYQKKLEDDYKMCQAILEDRELEITNLTEEMEDVVQQPLPSETIQIQDRTFRLEEQIVGLQKDLMAAQENHKEEIKDLTQKKVLIEEELISVRRENDLLQAEVKGHKEKIQEVETEFKDQNQVLEEKTKKLQEQTCLHHKMEEELQQVHTQLGQLKFEKQKFSTSQEMLTLQQQYQTEITDLKDAHIVLENQLCRDYEERIAAQINDVRLKFGKEEADIINRVRLYYESTLTETAREKDQAIKDLEKCHNDLKETAREKDQAVKDLEECRNDLKESHKYSEARSRNEALGKIHPREDGNLYDSFEELETGVAQEVSKSEQLDASLLNYLSQDTRQSGQASSIISHENEAGNVASRVDRLMQKIHQEGLQVLSLVERVFLQQHQDLLEDHQKAFLSQSGILSFDSPETSINASRESSPKSCQAGIDALVSRGERTQLLRRMASLQEELSKKEEELHKKVGIFEFRIGQEKMIANEWRLTLESKKKSLDESNEQLRQERLLGAEQLSELAFLRTQHSTLQLQLRKMQEEKNDIREKLESSLKQLEMKQEDLKAEQRNFHRISKMLDHQRHISVTTRNNQESIIKELRNTLESERETMVTQNAKLNELQTKYFIGKRKMRSTKKSTSMEVLDNSNYTSSEDMKVQLGIEQERTAELQKKYDREVMKVTNLCENLRVERTSAKGLLMEEQGKSAELTKLARNLEVERESLLRKVASYSDKLDHQQSRVQELESELARLEAELRAQTAAHEASSHKVREEDAQLHMTYTSTLNKLGEAEAEVCTLRQKNNMIIKDLELGQEKEKQLKEELNTERMANSRLGLPALARINNLNEYFELQLRENVELCKSVLRLSDDRHNARLKIISLESTISDLTEELVKAKAAVVVHPSPEMVRRVERSAWETERASLQSLITHKDAELVALRRGTKSRTATPNMNTPADDSGLQYIYGKYLHSESWRKALVFQKKYLLVLLEGYEATEERTEARLTAMAQQVYGPADTERSQRRLSPRQRFRVVVHAVIASLRMQFLVERWKRSRRLGSQVLVPNHRPGPTFPATLDADYNSRPPSSVASGPRLPLDAPREERIEAAARPSSLMESFTGQTPPTKEPSRHRMQTPRGHTASTPRGHTASRNLFVDADTRNLDEYIERLRSIHSTLGLSELGLNEGKK